eukprot:m.236676 g.236676  ORF g.236676 m.236676 type:complete len:2012 (+) comp17415_c0_seq8:117-6152(+)
MSRWRLWGRGNDHKSNVEDVPIQPRNRIRMDVGLVVESIKPGLSLTKRAENLYALLEVLDQYHLTSEDVQELWVAVRDMVNREQKDGIRKAGLTGLRALVQRLSPIDGGLKSHFCQVLKDHTAEKDAPLVVDILNRMTKGGLDVVDLGEQLGVLLVQLLPQCIEHGGLVDALALTSGLIRHHFHILDEGTARELLSNMCATCQISGDAQEIAGALDVIEELISVQALPVSSVQEVLLTLCQAACVSSFNTQAGELVQRLINTSPALGRVCYRELLSLLKIPKEARSLSVPNVHTFVLRGVINFVSRLGWRDLAVSTITIRPEVILPAFQRLVQPKFPGVVFEIVTSIRWLIQRRAKLGTLAWNSCFQIAFACAECLPATGEPAVVFKATVHELATWARMLVEQEAFFGNVEDLYNLMELSSVKDDVMVALEVHALRLQPGNLQWMERLGSFLQRYIVDGTKHSDVRNKAVEVLDALLQEYKHLYDEDIIAGPVTRHLSPLIHKEVDIQLRMRLITLFKDAAMRSSACFDASMQVLEQGFDLTCNQSYLGSESLAASEVLLTRPDRARSGLSTTNTGVELSPEVAAAHQRLELHLIDTFVQLFKHGLDKTPSTRALRPLRLLVQYARHAVRSRSIRHASFAPHLPTNDADDEPTRTDSISVVVESGSYSDDVVPVAEMTLFTLLTQLRWDATQRVFLTEVGFNDPESSCIFLSGNESSVGEEHMLPLLRNILDIFTSCLVKTMPFQITRMVTHAMAEMLLLTEVVPLRMLNFDQLATAVSHLIPHLKSNASVGYANADFQVQRQFVQHLFQILDFVAVTPEFRARQSLSAIVKTLVNLLRSYPLEALHSITAFTLLQQRHMKRWLPEVLNSLMTMKSSIKLQLSLLEFLSLLGRIPALLGDLQRSEYNQIFSIILECLRRHSSKISLDSSTGSRSHPSTPSKPDNKDKRNAQSTTTTPSKESNSKADHEDYIRLLSRHVLALWFARCPLKQRPVYAKIVADELKDIEGHTSDVTKMAPANQVMLQLLARYMYSNQVEVYAQALPEDVEGLFHVEGVASPGCPSKTHIAVWCQGQAIMTARCSPTGWMELRAHSSTGTVAHLTRLMTPNTDMPLGSTAFDIWLADLLDQHPERPRAESANLPIETDAAVPDDAVIRAAAAARLRLPGNIPTPTSTLSFFSDDQLSLEAPHLALKVETNTISTQTPRVLPGEPISEVVDRLPHEARLRSCPTSPHMQRSASSSGMLEGMRGRLRVPLLSPKRLSSRVLSMENIAQGTSPSEGVNAVDFLPLNLGDTALTEEEPESGDLAASPSQGSPSVLASEVLEVQLQRKVDANLQQPASDSSSYANKLMMRAHRMRESSGSLLSTSNPTSTLQDTLAIGAAEARPSSLQESDLANISTLRLLNASKEEVLPIEPSLEPKSSPTEDGIFNLTIADNRVETTSRLSRGSTSSDSSAKSGRSKRSSHDSPRRRRRSPAPLPFDTTMEQSESSTASSQQSSSTTSPRRQRSHTTPVHDPSQPQTIPVRRSNSDEGVDGLPGGVDDAQPQPVEASKMPTPQIDVEAAPFVAETRSRSNTGRSVGHVSFESSAGGADNTRSRPDSNFVLKMLSGGDTKDSPSAGRHQSLDGSALKSIRDSVRRKHAASTGTKPELRHLSDPEIRTGLSRQRSQTLAVLRATDTDPKQSVNSEMSTVKVDDASLAQAMAQFYVASSQPGPYSNLRPSMVNHEVVDKATAQTNPPGKGRGSVGPSSPAAAKPMLPRALPYSEFQKSRLADQLKMLNKTPALETHKIGVVYIGAGQTSSGEIFANECGSMRYRQFLEGLGSLIRLRGSREYCGGLDSNKDADGLFTIVWKDALSSVVFHVATLMPTRPSDKQCTNKKRYIDNNSVSLIYNDSGRPFDRSVLPGHVNQVFIVVEPLDNSNFRVSVLIRPGMEKFVSLSQHRVLTNEHVAVHVRQMAIHANLAVLAHQKKPSTWDARFVQITSMINKFGISSAQSSNMSETWRFLPFGFPLQ